MHELAERSDPSIAVKVLAKSLHQMESGDTPEAREQGTVNAHLAFGAIQGHLSDLVALQREQRAQELDPGLLAFLGGMSLAVGVRLILKSFRTITS